MTGQFMNERMKVLVIGGVGSNNIGDDAMLVNVIHDVEKFFPGSEIKVFVEEPDTCSYLKDVVKYPMVKSINKYFIPYSKGRLDWLRELFADEWTIKNKRIIARGMNLVNNINDIESQTDLPEFVRVAVRTILESDIIIDVGGANLNELWKVYFYEKCFNFLLAGKAGKKLYLSGQSVEPIKTDLDRQLLIQALNAATDITTRERISEQYIRKIGVTTPVETTGDDALTLACPPPGEIDRLFRQEGLSGSEEYIGFQFRDYLDLKNPEVYRKIAEIIDEAIEQSGLSVLCIPFHYGISDERTDVEKVISLCRNRDRIFKVKGHYDAIQIKGFVSKMKICFGISYHFYIYSASLGIPVLPLYKGAHYTQKFNGLTELFGLQDLKVDLESTGTDQFSEIVRSFLLRREEIQHTLAENNSKLKEKVHQSRMRWKP